MQHAAVDKIKLITKETICAIDSLKKAAKSKCHVYFATEEDLSREEMCKHLQEAYDIVEARHQHSIQRARDAVENYSINMKRLAEDSTTCYSESLFNF